jgi:dTDP-4-amino-4,6-dideoxygalactose transaminase
MFGYPCAIEPIEKLTDGRDIFVLEDACQAPGAKLGGKMAGSMGDAGFFSLCKGKNFSTFNGGLVTTNSDALAERLRIERDVLPDHGALFKGATLFKLIALSVAMHPLFYRALYPLIAPFKSTTLHNHFEPMRYTEFQSVIGEKLLEKLVSINECRKHNGTQLRNSLQPFKSLTFPMVIDGAEPVHNHLPLVFKDERVMDSVQATLWKRGVDTARMYERPIHHIYNLGYSIDPDPFPAATYVARRLMVLPTHPFLRGKDLRNITKVFQEHFDEQPPTQVNP